MKWVQGEVLSQREWAPGLYSIFVKAPVTFTAGQFTQLTLTPESHGLFRPYSYVNAPMDEVNEFYYTLVKGGEFTSRLTELDSGAPIWLAIKPSGRLILDLVPEGQNLWLLATGTGLGPFLSILKTEKPWQRFKKIVLVHSVRYQQELTHADLIDNWMSQYPNQFHWCPIVTREDGASSYSQRITDLIASQQLEQHLQLALNRDSQVMLCGNPQMIKDTNHLLLERGLVVNTMHQPGQITFESYWKS